MDSHPDGLVHGSDGSLEEYGGHSIKGANNGISYTKMKRRHHNHRKTARGDPAENISEENARAKEVGAAGNEAMEN